MDKYIVEIDGKNICSDSDGKSKLALSVKSNNGYAVFCTEIPLTPYTEPDLEKVRKEAYDKAYADAVYNCSEGCSHVEQIRQKAYKEGVEDGKRLCPAPEVCNDMAYQKGLSDAWDAARKIGSNSMCSLKEMGFDFTRCAVPDYNPSWFVVKNYSAQEVIEEIRTYEQAQKEKEEKEENDSVTTEEVMRRYLDKFCKRNFCTKCLLHTPDFTCGRGYHFLTNHPVSDEEVRRAYAKVVQKMRE